MSSSDRVLHGTKRKIILMKTLTLHGKPLHARGPALICAPLIAHTAEELFTELAVILPKQPDVIEWRVDFFGDIAHQAKVIEAARHLRVAAGATPIIFTRRAAHEGGQPLSLDESAVLALYEAVMASGFVDFVDYELSQSPAHRARLRAVSRAHGVMMIMSYHNFQSTPHADALVEILATAEREEADVAKLAVMPLSSADVLVLLEASLKASQTLSIPLITMSMGGLGAITRVCGWQYGSALTFAVGKSSSAPGQIAIEELRLAMHTLARATLGR